jgi:RecQ family ATP-dependent DNA helicase
MSKSEIDCEAPHDIIINNDDDIVDEYEKNKLDTPRYKKIKTLLKEKFNYDEFKPKQYEIINNIIRGNNICAILPTSYGKSLTFQIPALYLKKPTLVVTPLISLMEDQCNILSNLGISACYFNSNVKNKEKLKNEILDNKYLFIYITPESIVGQIDFINELDATIGLSHITIDEAHCISSYGFDFRPAYRKLKQVRKMLPEVPILALTATATTDVIKDICKILKIESTPIKISFDRPNLYLQIKPKTKNKKIKDNYITTDLYSIIARHEGEPGVIYCITIKEIEKIVTFLRLKKINCNFYHGRMNAEDRNISQNSFMNGHVNIMVATIAFGMGINKSNIRFVVHIGLPKTLEGYYQEIGRAGRDGNISYCYMFYDAKDMITQELLISSGAHDRAYVEHQIKLLNVIKEFADSKKCRRIMLLKYFNEVYPNQQCDFCDNCCVTDDDINDVNGDDGSNYIAIRTTIQDITTESIYLIDLMESLEHNYGYTMYIDILRGSAKKSIKPFMKKNIAYGKGKYKSVEWWKECIGILVRKGLVSENSVRGKATMKVLKVTKDGIQWAKFSSLPDFFSAAMQQKNYDLDCVEMTNTK